MTNPVKPAEPVVDSPELRRLVGDYMHDCQMVRGHAIPSWRRLIAHITGLVKDECTLCNGMGMLDGAGSICPHCDGRGKEPVLARSDTTEVRKAVLAEVERIVDELEVHPSSRGGMVHKGHLYRAMRAITVSKD